MPSDSDILNLASMKYCRMCNISVEGEKTLKQVQEEADDEDNKFQFIFIYMVWHKSMQTRLIIITERLGEIRISITQKTKVN